MRKLWAVTPEASHEDVFVQRYQRLLRQALHITSQSRSAAEDLVHDAFIQFTLSQPDLGAIHDLDSYLFITLRNMHLSQVRRASQAQFTPLSIADYDSAEIGLRAVDVQFHLQVAEELRRICHYACVRKESSKAGSVMILRFFHGYYTNEIAQVIRSPRRTVYEWLQIARREAKRFLADPHSLKFIADQDRMEEEIARSSPGHTRQGLLSELRESIFRSRQGSCLPAKRLQKLYTASDGATVECGVLAHIVSCQRCLEEVNKLRRLPPFSDRYPTDTLGPDTRSRRGGDEMNISAQSKDSTTNLMKICRRRLGEVIDHQPQALSFSANGFILGSQKVSSDVTEQILSINIDEEINFVEVFSEQGIRLMFMGIAPPATDGVEQKARLALDEGRELECGLSFNNPWPTLHVTYRDPSLKAESVVASENVEAEQGGGLSPTYSPAGSNESRFGRLRRRFASLIKARLAIDTAVLLRPGTVTAFFALLLIASLALWYLRTPNPAVVSAADLLARSTVAEESTAAQKDIVVHRTINLEEKSATGEVIARDKIEIWQSAERGITARRLYDERGNLIAGDWRRSDGVQTLYHHGAQPRLQLAPDKRASAPLVFDSVWQLSPSAKEFSSLIGSAEQARVEDGPTSYVISYERPYEVHGADSANQGLVKATLTLSRNDLRAVDETLLVQQGAELREYRFAEASFERHRPATVAPGVFEPDPVLLSEGMRDEGGRMKPEAESLHPSSLIPHPSVVATPELEIEVLRLLNQVGADTGEQVSVRRTASGVLQIDAILDTDERKKEILRALGSVIHNPALRADVQTVAERVAREAEQANATRSRPSAGSVTVERIQPTTNSVPLEPELRRYLLARGVSKSQIDEEVQRFCRLALGQSSQALQHAGALKNLAGRFSPEELRTLDEESRAKWLDLIREHAQALRQNNAALRQELGAALAMPEADSVEEMDVSSDAGLVQVVNRLFALCSANDATVRSALSLSTDTSKAAAIKGAQFWRSLASAESLAAQIQNRER